MAYTQETCSKVKDILSQRRIEAANKYDRRKIECFEKYPELEEIQMKLGQIGCKITKCFLEGNDVETAFQKLKDESLYLQEQKKEILIGLGYPKDYLKMPYTCSVCSDTGVFGDRLCQCQKDLLKQVEIDRIKKIAPIDKCSFDTFDVKYYSDIKNANGISPRELAESVLKGCKKYASNFSMRSKNLLLIGGTGLGKTHLSLALARAAIDKGYGVIYGSAQNIFSDMENIKFNKAFSSVRYEEKAVLDCDLLIIDDLGSEFISSYTTSSLYNIINSRMLVQKPTIVSTNLNGADLERTYDQRITSRLMNDYTILRFIGQDIRQLKKKI